MINVFELNNFIFSNGNLTKTPVYSKSQCKFVMCSSSLLTDKDQLLEIAKANAAAMCAKAGIPIPESLRPKAVLQLPLPNPMSFSMPMNMNMPMNMPMNMSMNMPMSMTMNAAMASMTAATMTAALASMGSMASMHQMAPLPSITNKPPPGPPQPNMATIEDVKRKVAKQANSISIKEFTDVSALQCHDDDDNRVMICFGEDLLSICPGAKCSPAPFS